MRQKKSAAASLALATPLTILLAACVGPAPQAPRPIAPPAARPAAPAPVSPAPVATEWQYRPATPGNWTYRSDASGASALFGLSATNPQLVLRCDRAARRVSLTRAGAGQGAMVVRTSYGATSWPASAAAGQVPMLTAVRAASDTVLDQLAYSRGRFAVEVRGQEMLIVPAWAEIGRVIEDCRG